MSIFLRTLRTIASFSSNEKRRRPLLTGGGGGRASDRDGWMGVDSPIGVVLAMAVLLLSICYFYNHCSSLSAITPSLVGLGAYFCLWRAAWFQLWCSNKPRFLVLFNKLESCI
jgi:hypothetical protein